MVTVLVMFWWSTNGKHMSNISVHPCLFGGCNIGIKLLPLIKHLKTLSKHMYPTIPKFWGGVGGLYVLKEVSYAHQSCIKKNIRNVLLNVLLLSWISKTVVLCCISLFLGLCLIESSKQQHFSFFTLCIFTVTLGNWMCPCCVNMFSLTSNFWMINTHNLLIDYSFRSASIGGLGFSKPPHNLHPA